MKVRCTLLCSPLKAVYDFEIFVRGSVDVPFFVSLPHRRSGTPCSKSSSPTLCPAVRKTLVEAVYIQAERLMFDSAPLYASMTANCAVSVGAKTWDLLQYG